MPGLGPGIPFRRGVSPGVAPVAGVEFASAFDSASAEDGRAAGASVEEAGEDCSVGLSGLDVGSGVWVLVSGESGVSSMNCRRASGASLRVTRSVVGAFFVAPARLERPLGVEPAGMVDAEKRRGNEGTRRWIRGEVVGWSWEGGIEGGDDGSECNQRMMVTWAFNFSLIGEIAG